MGIKYGFAEVGVMAIARQKDEFYIRQLDERFRDALGPRRLHRWFRGDSMPFSAALYYLLTHGAGTMTLGEEYGQILPVDTRAGGFPSLWKRLVVAVSAAWMPSPWWLVLVLFHRALFYWQGKYPDVIRRILSLRYIYFPRRLPESPRARMIYRIVGTITVAIAVSRAMELWRIAPLTRLLHSAPKEASEGDEEVPHVERCSLCLGQRQNTAVASCGHLFCWTCLLGWLQMRQQCPLCRQQCLPAHVYCIKDPWIGQT